MGAVCIKTSKEEDFFKDKQTLKRKEELSFDLFLENQSERKKKQDQKFTTFLREQQEKKQKEDQKFTKFLKQQQEKEEKRKQAQKLQYGTYAKKVKQYTERFGKQVTMQTKEFIQKNYNYNYSSQTRGLRYPASGLLTLTYKSSLISRFEKAYQNNMYTIKLQMKKLNQSEKYLEYKWIVKSKGKNVYYDCKSYFDSQDNFLKATFDQREPPYDHTQYMKNYTPAPTKVTKYQSQSSSGYYGPPPTDWSAHYNAEVARSNQQFRQNMNRQAQDWNNYVTQKANRGW